MDERIFNMLRGRPALNLRATPAAAAVATAAAATASSMLLPWLLLLLVPQLKHMPSSRAPGAGH
jgi:hypothetical protein